MPVSLEEDDAEYAVGGCVPLTPVPEMPSEYPDEDTDLVPCSHCSRTFNPVSLSRHEQVCQKVQTKKRNSIDSTKNRKGDGSDLKEKKHVPKKKSRWREKHKEFLNTIRAARITSDDSDDGSPQRRIPSDYIKCCHCDRYFGPKAAERHISWCAEQKTRFPRSHTSEDTVATQRLKTRTKYTPPKPGQSGWRAPKKKDVISSIPPPNAGPNITPAGRLTSPPPVYQRQISPPLNSHSYPPPPNRHFSPPPMSPSRRGTLASLPPGPPRYGGSTSSLGRSSGKQFSAMMQSVTGCTPGYGLSTGYGSSSLYGKAPQQFNRSASLRLPRKRPTGGNMRMARHRDLASDMLASVSSEGKREEPEGGEDRRPRRSFEGYSYKGESALYDPFSAAELQLQDLLGPGKAGVGGMRSDFMGSTGSLKGVGLGLTRQALEIRDYSPPKRGFGSMSLCSFRMDPLEHILQNDLKSHAGEEEDSSEIESLDSSRGMQSPINEFEDLLASLTTNNHNRHHNGSMSNNVDHIKTVDPPRYDSRSRSVSSQSSKSPFMTTTDNNYGRSIYDGLSTWRKSSSPSPPYRFSPSRLSPEKERSPPYQSPRTPISGFNKNGGGYTPTTSNTIGWTNPELIGSSHNYSRYLRKKSPLDVATSKLYSYKTPRPNIDREKQLSNSALLRLDDQRASSGSSTDSSFPPLSSSASNSGPMKATLTSSTSAPISLPKFCYECGNKYPVMIAKFCCQCGAPRMSEVK